MECGVSGVCLRGDIVVDLTWPYIMCVPGGKEGGKVQQGLIAVYMVYFVYGGFQDFPFCVKGTMNTENLS